MTLACEWLGARMSRTQPAILSEGVHHGQLRRHQRHRNVLALRAAPRAGRCRLVRREVVAKEATDDLGFADAPESATCRLFCAGISSGLPGAERGARDGFKRLQTP
jgi:hypothetical protein